MKTIIFAFSIALSMLFTSRAFAQCPPDPPGCGYWTVEDSSDCELEFVWETPPPYVTAQGAGTLSPYDPVTTWQAPCIAAGDCGSQCAWALRLIDPSSPGYVFYGHSPSPSVYYNVRWCSACKNGTGGWIMATYTAMPPNHLLRFKCQP